MAENSNEKMKMGKKKFRKGMHQKTLFLFFVFFLAFVVLFIKLASIIMVDGTNYKKKVFNQAIQREGDRYIEFKRGDITDRNGIVLAGTKQVFQLVFDPKLLNTMKQKNNKTEVEKYEKTLSLLVSEQIRTQAELEEILDKKKDYNYVVLESEMDYRRVEKIKDAIDKNQTGGLFYEVKNKRKYPYPLLAPELIGFVKGNNVGEGGIEEYYNDMLIGEVGRRYGILDHKTVAIDKEVAATDGYQIMLNLDYSIQKYISDAAEEYLKNHNPRSVTIIVADPRNMDILGFKSYPTYSLEHPYEIEDLERPADVETVNKKIENIILIRRNDLLKERTEEVLKNRSEELEKRMQQEKTATEKERDQLKKKIASEIPLPTLEEIKKEEVITEEEQKSMYQRFLLQNRWKNIALTNGIEPGSIAKVFTYAVGLEEKKINPENYYYCEGGLQVADFFIRCHKVHGHGAQNAEQGLSNSCNVVLMNLGKDIGRDLFSDFQHKFGFGAITGIDLAGETSQRKNIYTKKELNEVQLATSSFGQGFNVTPIQMLTAFSAAINGGYLYEPHVVKRIFDAEGNLFENKDKTLIRQVISEETSAKIRQSLRGVVTEGTGRSAKISGYDIGGKTSTSEKLPRGNGKYTVAFIGFAPIENPEVITLVIVDEPEGADQDSKIPARIFRSCMEKIMPYLHIFKAEEGEDEK